MCSFGSTPCLVWVWFFFRLMYSCISNISLNSSQFLSNSFKDFNQDLTKTLKSHPLALRSKSTSIRGLQSKEIVVFWDVSFILVVLTRRKNEQIIRAIPVRSPLIGKNSSSITGGVEFCLFFCFDHMHTTSYFWVIYSCIWDAKIYTWSPGPFNIF